MTNRQLFFNQLAQTSPAPMGLEIARAKGVYLFSPAGKKYLDLISGISVSNVGHAHPKVVKAVKEQADKFMHLMVYGEYVQSPQVKLAKRLTGLLPKKLNNVYFVNSGSEAVEGALKLAKRYTGRTEIVAFKNAYHGSTHGALSVMGNETMKQAFRPLLPDVRFLEFNNEKQLEQITSKTACVLVEPIQGEAGVVCPLQLPRQGRVARAVPLLKTTEGCEHSSVRGGRNFLQLLRQRCDAIGALLIFDEIQTGMGRTGKLFAFERYKVVPDILCLAKAFGGGMPLGAFISSKEIMSSLSHDPALGHITTFGGHPVCCAAALVALEILTSPPDPLQKERGVKYKGELFKKLLVHPRIKEVRGEGLLLAVQFAGEEENKKIISRCIENGVVVDWFLFRADAMRIAPPLIISEKEIKWACKIILKNIDE